MSSSASSSSSSKSESRESSKSCTVYLDCPKEEKDDARALGAKWDASARKWFVPVAMYPILHQFNRWRPNDKMYLNCPYKEKDDAKAAGAKFDGHVKKWYIAVPTNKTNKPPAKFAQWLDPDSFSSSSPSSSNSRKASAANSTSEKKQQKQGPKTNERHETDKNKNNSKKDTKPSKKQEKKDSASLSSAASSVSLSSSLDSLARISPSLSIAQLQHELLQREPSAKGLSNKNKAHFLSRLGEGSIWITSPDCPLDTDFLMSLPRVTSALTSAQLCHELMYRSPTTKGTSGKNKAWFLGVLGEGSIWMTAPSLPKMPSSNIKSSSSSSSSSSKRASSAKSSTTTTSKKASSATSSKKALDPVPEQKKRKGAPSGGKASQESQPEGGGDSKSDKEATKKEFDEAKNDQGRNEKKIKLEEQKPTTKKTSSSSSSSKTTTVATPTKGAKKPPSKGGAPVASPALSQTSPASKRVQTTLEQALSKASNSETKPASSKKRPLPPLSMFDLATKCARRTSGTVHASMTLGEMRDECRSRGIKGFSGKSKEWLLSQLGEGTERLATSVRDSSSGTTEKGQAIKMELDPPKSEPVGNHKACSVATSVRDSSSATTESTTEKGQAIKMEPDPPKSESVGNHKACSEKNACEPSKVKAETPPSSQGTIGEEPPGIFPDTAASSSSCTAKAVFSTVVKSSATPSVISSSVVPAKMPEKQQDVVPTVSMSMTLEELRAECKARDPHIKGMSGKNKGWFMSHLGVGTERQASSEWRAKSDKEAQSLHIHQSRCHRHLLADSSRLRAPLNGRHRTGTLRTEIGICDFNRTHLFLCQRTAYRTCEQCDFDICRECYGIESLSDAERERVLQEKHERLRQQELEVQRRYEAEERRREKEHEEWTRRYEERRKRELEEEHGEDLKRFPSNIRQPESKHTDPDRKLKYTISKRSVDRSEKDVAGDFDSSFDSLKEANLRAEYVFTYTNDCYCGPYEVHAHEDKEINGMRYLRMDPADAESWIVSVMPSEAYDELESGDFDGEEVSFGFGMSGALGFGEAEDDDPEGFPARASFPSRIRDPSAKSRDKRHKLAFTVWKSCGYDCDGWHSYEGPPKKNFDSSFATLEDANERAKYVFFHQNPWGSGEDEMHAETNRVTKNGYRFLQCRPDDSERWTVSVISSVAFDHM